MQDQDNQTATARQNQMDDEINLMDLLLVIAKHNRLILKFTGSVALLALLISLLMDNVYTAKVMIMPPQQTQSSAASIMLSQVGALGSLTGIDKNPSGLYIAMLKSRSVADYVIDRFKLMSVYKKKTYVATRKKLEDSVTMTAGKEGMISIEFDDTDPKRAAAIANGYILGLDTLVRRIAVTEAGRRRLFFENELKKSRDNLDAADLAMKSLQEKTGVISIEAESTSILTAEANLRAQVAAKEIELSAMRGFATAQNPDVRRAEQMLVSLRAQLAKLEGQRRGTKIEMPAKNKIPSMAIDYMRRMRDLKYYEGLLTFVSQQLASARLDEAKDAPVIQVVDKALVPEKKTKPKRALIVILATLMAFFMGVLFAFFKEASERASQDPASAERMNLLRRYLRSGA
ncbi:WzzB Chain length determinant protein [Methylophilaceae bacterium]